MCVLTRLTLLWDIFGKEKEDSRKMGTSAIFRVVIELDVWRLFICRLYRIIYGTSFPRQSNFAVKLWIFERSDKFGEV